MEMMVYTTSLVEFSVTNLGIRINCAFIELCLTLSKCHCDSNSRRYLPEIPSRAYRTSLLPKGCGVLLEKIQADFLIRSSSRLIYKHLYDKRSAGHRKTKQRLIYLAATAPLKLDFGLLDIMGPVGVELGGGIELGLVAPESRWDFSHRCFLTRWTSDEHSWVLVVCRIPKERLLYASHDIAFSVLFEFYSRSILVLDDSKFNKRIDAILRDGESWAFEDVFNYLSS
jgi:hypothetical protein